MAARFQPSALRGQASREIGVQLTLTVHARAIVLPESLIRSLATEPTVRPVEVVEVLSGAETPVSVTRQPRGTH